MVLVLVVVMMLLLWAGGCLVGKWLHKRYLAAHMLLFLHLLLLLLLLLLLMLLLDACVMAGMLALAQHKPQVCAQRLCSPGQHLVHLRMVHTSTEE